MAASGLTDAGNKALREVEKCQGFHDKLVADTEQRWAAFEGRMDTRADSAQWQSQMHPPFLNHIVETVVAGLLEDRFAFDVRPKPRFYNPGEFDLAQEGARAHQDIVRAQLKDNRFNEFQRPFALQAAVCRLSVAKTYWKKEEGPRSRLVEYDAGLERGLPVSIPGIREESNVEESFNGPVTECVDIRDFYWDEAATCLENARWVAHATWVSYDDLLKLAKRGIYDMDAVKQLKNRDQNDVSTSDVESDREQRGRKKGRIERLEIWNRETREVTVLGARSVELRPANRKWPFWHGQYPFTVASLQPFPFSLQGMSIVEKLMHLQDACWDLMNQRHDNLRFINNQITIVDPDIEDPDSIVYEPGAVWFTQKDKVAHFAPDASPAQVSLPAEQMLQQTMQNLAGGHPFTSTSEADSVGASTATEAALVTNLAQQAEKAMKNQLMYAYERIGCQILYLNQQFIRKPYYLHKIGLGDTPQEQEVLPIVLQGDYLFDISPMAESLMRQEKRAEQNALFQIVAQTAPVVAAAGAPWNIKAFQEDLLKSYDKQNTERYLSAQQQPQVAAAGQPNQADAQPGVGPQSAGVTAPQSIDPAVSPSAPAALSGATPMARQLSMGGGVANAA